MRHFFIQLTVIICILTALASCGQKTGTASKEQSGLSADTLQLAADEMQQLTDSGRYSGISTLVMKDGMVVDRGAFGYANLSEQKPIENNTIYRIFSMTKPVTAVALMTLYDQGKFRLDDKVSDFIPEFKGTRVYVPDAGGSHLENQDREMTIRHLLTHTSGITYGWDQDSYVDSLYRVTGVGDWDSALLEEKVRLLAELPLKYQPGTRWDYGLSIDVAGYLVELLSGIPLDDYFQAVIFDPLEMDDTGFFVPEEKHDRLAGLYFRDGDGNLNGAGVWGDRFKQPAVLLSGGGGLVSTVDDYLKFCRMLLNGGEVDGVRILREPTVDLIMSDQLPEGVDYEAGIGYGLAGAVHLESGTYSWAGLASTNFWIDPGNEMIIITCTQLMPGDHSYAYKFRDRVYRALDVK